MEIIMNEHRKSFLISAGAGCLFGLAASVIILQEGIISWHPFLIIIAVTLASGLFSGCAGLAASVLENRLRDWGVKQGLPRLIISFGAVALVTLAVTVSAVYFLGGGAVFTDFKQYAFLGTAAGITFGAIFALINYRSELTRERLKLLEMENRHLADLASREELLQEAARNLTVAEERTRMARELHDSIAQGMHGIIYSLRSLRGVLSDNPRGMEILGHLDETASNTLQELRRLVMELSPSPLENNTLEEALRLHCDLFARRQKLELILRLEYKRELQPDQEVAIYRITQEALANVQKHAEASRISVFLHSSEKATVLSIGDDGKGFDPAAAKSGHGLVNMANRARQSGGVLHLESGPHRGTTLTVNYVRGH